MPNPSNSDLVGEARRLSEAATPGPWEQEGPWIQLPGGEAQIAEGYDDEQGLKDAEFIARARTLLPELAQQLEQAEQREKALQEFVTAHTLIEKGVVDFDLHGEAVERFKRASESEHVLPIIRAALTTPDSATEQEER